MVKTQIFQDYLDQYLALLFDKGAWDYSLVNILLIDLFDYPFQP